MSSLQVLTFLLLSSLVTAFPNNEVATTQSHSTHDLTLSHPHLAGQWDTSSEEALEAEIWSRPKHVEPVGTATRIFRINLMTFTTIHCQKEGMIGTKMHHVKETERCHGFEEPFNSYFAGWRDYQTYFEKETDYGNCTIFEWEDQECAGRLVGRLENANTIVPRSNTKKAECMGPFTDLRGKRGSAMSMKIVCDR